MPRPILATIHIDSMKHNLALAKAKSPCAKAWGVLKANGYGHGLERAMRGFTEADGLALIDVDNAVKLRDRWPAAVPEPLVALLDLSWEDGGDRIAAVLDAVVTPVDRL